MDALGEAIGRDSRSSATALRAPAVGRSYDYRRFCTSAWKVGNFLRHHGVRGRAGVGIADDPLPEPVLTFYGAALLGAIVQFDPDGMADPRALVVPEADIDALDPDPGAKRIAYGTQHEDPSVSYFERDVWSENPTEPPDRIGPDDPLLRTPESTYTHGELLAAAERVVETQNLEAGDEVAVHGPVTDPNVVAAGLIAPILAGGAIVLGPDADGDVVAGGPDGNTDTNLLA
jgi:hypothetical protein